MDIDEIRQRIHDLADTGSAYRVEIETEDGPIYDMPILGSDAVQVVAVAVVSLLTMYSTIEDMPPTGQIVVRVVPEDSA